MVENYTFTTPPQSGEPITIELPYAAPLGSLQDEPLN